MIDDMTPSVAAGPDEAPRKGRTALYVIITVLILGAVGALTTAAMSAGFGSGPGFGHGWWHHGGFMRGPLSPAEIEDRADRGVRHLAIEIDATPEQQEKLRAVVSSALKDLLPMRDQFRSGRQRAASLLTQATVNREEIEKFRAEQMALADQASKRIASALAEAAEVLTPEQRQKIGEHIASRMGRWHSWGQE